jgi:predicted nuclease of restriction endonuclease-like (RecB) superfamily
MELLSKSNAADISGLVSAEEVYAIAQNIQHEQYVNTPKTRPHTAAPYVYKFVSYKDTLEFLQSAAEFCVKILQTT